ncbi:MAG TPA: Smr/MutS family protein [Gemmatimonadales bacterium]|nr:Smr/MutS family protein [Gemmatimonadales bacterium]
MRRRSASTFGHDPFDPLEGRVDDTLDLHGLTAAGARTRLEQYFAGAKRQRPGQLVHIITGKGRNSPSGAVLKPAVRSLLRSGAISDIARWGIDDDEGGFLVRVTGGRFG